MNISTPRSSPRQARGGRLSGDANPDSPSRRDGSAVFDGPSWGRDNRLEPGGSQNPLNSRLVAGYTKWTARETTVLQKS